MRHVGVRPLSGLQLAEDWIGPFSSFSVSLTLLTDKSKGIAEFKRSLAYSGTIVVYMGHTSLIPTRKKTYVAEGLAPQGPKKPMLKNRALVALLQKAKANIVILAGCATDTSVTSKLKNNVIVITTASGHDGVTDSADRARALTAFLLALVGWDFDGKTVSQRTGGTATVQEAIDVANKLFPKGDLFVLESGDGSVRELSAMQRGIPIRLRIGPTYRERPRHARSPMTDCRLPAHR